MRVRRGDHSHTRQRSEDDTTGATPPPEGPAESEAAQWGDLNLPYSTVGFDGNGNLQGEGLGEIVRFGVHDVADKSTLRLGDLLVGRGLVTAAQVNEALAKQNESGGRLGQILVDMGVLGERGLVDALAWKFDMPECDLRTQIPQADALALVPEETARAQLALPVSLSGNIIFIAVAEPSEELQELLETITKHEVHLMIVPVSDVRQAIDSNYGALGGVTSLVQVFQTIEGGRRRSAEPAKPEVIADDAPVVQVVNRILTQARRDRASDVHIEPQDNSTRVRYRIDGVMKEMLILPAAMGLGLVNRIKIMAEMNIVERRRPQDGQFTTTVDDGSVDVRVSTLATIWGEKCVMRILDKTRSVLLLEHLGMPASIRDKYSGIIRAPFGMVVCAGPTGSGKTTTLYATLNELNDPTRNIMTIEDPVEYVFPSMNQIQTNEQAGLTFATGLKSILRQDPDIILVGEVRDVETARIAVQSAMTGHLVLSSLHATDTVTALLRFYDMGIEPFLIAASVIAVVSQRLVRRICPACKTRYTPTPEERAFYEETEGPEKSIFYRGDGCNFCARTGYQDRIGVYELLETTPQIKRLIIAAGTHEELRTAAQQQGMRSLRQEAIDLVAQDITTVSEVVRSIYTL
jgi:type IV pilus assembly protein PilB